MIEITDYQKLEAENARLTKLLNEAYGLFNKAFKDLEKEREKNKYLTSKQYIENLKEDKWSKKRKEILILDNFKCVECEKNNDLHVHHLLYFNNKQAWEYENNMLVTLCSECHEKEHKNYGTGNFKRSLYYQEKTQPIRDPKTSL